MGVRGAGVTDPPTRAGADDRTVVSYDSCVAPIAGADTEGARLAVRGSSRPVDCEEDGRSGEEGGA